MKKINQFTKIIILLIFITACAGYEPIFSSKNLKFSIVEHSIEGDKILGNKIYSKLKDISGLNKNDNNASTINILINVTKDKKATSKDIAGKILEYKITLTLKMQIEDAYSGNKILNKNFTKSSTYKMQSQYSDTMNIENQLVENLINNIYQELLISISQNIQK